MTLKMSWAEFIEMAMREIRTVYTTAEEPKFWKKQNYEPDGEMYDYPDYVECELAGKGSEGRG